jgi:hypothetical protein
MQDIMLQTPIVKTGTKDLQGLRLFPQKLCTHEVLEDGELREGSDTGSLIIIPSLFYFLAIYLCHDY